ncbi:hypothetical protein BMF94_6997 [Rhodotorula taiwanensis]|uniref:Uncharacterized protein n=1 Tax=Rhodotorula taiwanensis TaxID=741276 RepID=A0A2S5AZP6_9BASI|nr:hypothetical protein BMF94_6997 [Rhodotorula taiwanensis]
MFAGQGPSPAQLALAKMQARQSLRNFLVAIGVIRVVPFAFEYIYSLVR